MNPVFCILNSVAIHIGTQTIKLAVLLYTHFVKCGFDDQNVLISKVI